MPGRNDRMKTGGARPPRQAPSEKLADDEKTGADIQRVFSTAHGIGFEVRLVHDSGEPWRAIEVWTARSVYWLDHDRVCIAVMVRETGSFDPTHRYLGSLLTGGQERGEQGMSVARPLPIPGMKAVFRLKTGFAMTSSVEHIVIQVKIDNIADVGDEVDWNTVALGTDAGSSRNPPGQSGKTCA